MRWTELVAVVSALAVTPMVAPALDASPASVGEQTAVAAAKPRNEYLTRCGTVSVSGAESRGGCAVKIFAAQVRLTVLTPVGEIPFATCGISLVIRFGGSGRVAVDDVGITSFEGPCADAVTCLGPARGDADPRAPWTGAVRGDGNGVLQIVIDACLDTCIGRFQGPLLLDLERAERRWRLRALEAPVGKSGFVIDGEWSFRGEALDLRELPGD